MTAAPAHTPREGETQHINHACATTGHKDQQSSQGKKKTALYQSLFGLLARGPFHEASLTNLELKPEFRVHVLKIRKLRVYDFIMAEES